MQYVLEIYEARLNPYYRTLDKHVYLFFPKCGFQTDHVSVDNPEQYIREIIHQGQTGDVEWHPLILEIITFRERSTY